MVSSEVQRTLVKSPPELWAELSDPAALARHLDELGEIRITGTEPEKTVEWETADTTGKVTLAQSGWGTKVTLTVTREAIAEPAVEPKPAVVDDPAPEPESLAVEEPEPEPPVAEEPSPRQGFFARIFHRRPNQQAPPEPPVQAEPEIEPQQPEAVEITESDQPPREQTQDIAAELKEAEEVAEEEVSAVLTAVLDRLGAAHHRPFSRA